jgi:hypothetical protein
MERQVERRGAAGIGVQPSRTARVRGESRNPWFFLLFVAYWGLTAVMLWLLWPTQEIQALLNPISLVLIALASYRAGRIIAFDEVTQPLRLPFVEVYEEDGERVEKPRMDGWRGAIAALITCPDCVGYWLAAVFVYALLLFPMPAWVVLFILAVNGLGQAFTGVIEFLTKDVKKS